MNVLDPMPTNGFSPLDEGSNCIFLPYCDGASFSGYKEEPVMVCMQSFVQTAYFMFNS